MDNNWKTMCSLATLKQRAFLMSEIRKFFVDQGVLEVETPILSSAGNTDVNIESFTSQAINSDFEGCYLRTSPEFPLKRLLCSDMGDVFELGKVFRRGEISRTHNIEFTMLEWYRLGYRLNDLIKEVETLLTTIFSKFNKTILCTEVKTFKDCFSEFLDICLDTISIDQLDQFCRSFDYDGSPLTRDECLDYLFTTQIQNQLKSNNLIFVTHYPASQAALAQIDPEDSSSSLRFEVFYNGIELGNGYQELTDSDELRNRFNADNLKRIDHQRDSIALDNNLLSALSNGMPSCSGIAVGVDRLLMLLLDKDSISEVLTFSSLNS